MKQDKLIDAIGMINDEYIEEAHKPLEKKPWFNKIMITRLSVGFLCVCLCIGLIPNMLRMGKAKHASSAPADSYYNGTAYESDYAASEEMVYAPSALSGSANDNAKPESSSVKKPEADKKIITTGNMNVQTLDLDKTLEELLSRLSSCNGYVQSSSVSNSTYRYYDATLRIPSENYDAFISDVSGLANVTYYSEESKDITDSYNDISARVASLKAQEEKVMEFYKEATSIEELMSIESRLSEIRYEIDSCETRLKNYDVLTEYSTLNISIKETKVYTENKTGFFDRMSREFTSGLSDFVDSIEEIIFFATYNLFPLMVYAVIGFVGYKIVKKTFKKK